MTTAVGRMGAILVAGADMPLCREPRGQRTRRHTSPGRGQPGSLSTGLATATAIPWQIAYPSTTDRSPSDAAGEWRSRWSPPSSCQPRSRRVANQATARCAARPTVQAPSRAGFAARLLRRPAGCPDRLVDRRWEEGRRHYTRTGPRKMAASYPQQASPCRPGPADAARHPRAARDQQGCAGPAGAQRRARAARDVLAVAAHLDARDAGMAVETIKRVLAEGMDSRAMTVDEVRGESVQDLTLWIAARDAVGKRHLGPVPGQIPSMFEDGRPAKMDSNVEAKHDLMVRALGGERTHIVKIAATRSRGRWACTRLWTGMLGGSSLLSRRRMPSISSTACASTPSRSTTTRPKLTRKIRPPTLCCGTIGRCHAR